MTNKTSLTSNADPIMKEQVNEKHAIEERVIPRWTFLTNHAHVLAMLHTNPDLVLREVALKVGITERAVHKITHDLEECGYIEKERVGRKNRYKIVRQQPLRHPIESHRNIGDLLNLIDE